MTSLDGGIYGAKIQSWRRANPRNLLMRIITQNPGVPESELADAFWAEVQTDEECLKVITIDYWFPNNYRSLLTSNKRPRATTGQASKIRSQIKAGIRKEAKRMLLDFIMPNGKMLRNCTGRDCAKFGGWMGKIASKIKPGEVVGEKLSEDQVRKLCGR